MRALPTTLGAVVLVIATAASATAPAVVNPAGATVVPEPRTPTPSAETRPISDVVQTDTAANMPERDGNLIPPAFGRDRYIEHRGDVVELALRLPANGTGRLTLHRPTGNTTMTVHDDGDGRITVRLNTYTGTWSATGTDAVSTVEGAMAYPPAGDYRLTLRANGTIDEATLALEPRSLERISTWQAPADETAIETVADLRAAITDGTFDRATAVNESHLLVVGIKATGLEGALATAGGENVTTRFRNVVARHGDLEAVQHPDTVGVEQDPAVVHVLDGPGVRVLADASSDSYFVLVNLSTARLTQGDRAVDPERVASYDAEGMWLLVRATIANTSRLADEDERVTAVVAPRRASLSTAPDGTIHVAPGTTWTISGTTNVGTGWNVTVVVAGEDDPATAADESFRLTREATVEASDEERYRNVGRFDVSVAVPEIPPGANATVDVQFDGRSLLEAPVSLVVERRRASVATTGVDHSGTFTIVAVSASLSTGGFIVLHEGSQHGPVVGHSNFLAAGNHTVEVYVGEPTDADRVVAVAHRDANHNEWFDGPALDEPYPAGERAATTRLTTPRTTASPETKTASTPTASPRNCPMTSRRPDSESRSPSSRS